MKTQFTQDNASGLAPQLNEGFQTENEAGAAAGVAGAAAGAATGAAAGAATGAQTQPTTSGTGAAVMMPNMSGSGAIPTELPKAPPVDMSSIEGTNMTGSEPAPAIGSATTTTQPTVNVGGSPAAAVGTPTPSTLTTGTSAQTVPAEGTQPPTTSAFTNLADIGMFKLGELPSAAKNGPHIDAGTTIMRALGALNPDQINSLTEDTRKLVDTQKSLMNMLTTMKPMLSDGQNLLSSFTNMFGKQ